MSGRGGRNSFEVRPVASKREACSRYSSVTRLHALTYVRTYFDTYTSYSHTHTQPHAPCTLAREQTFARVSLRLVLEQSKGCAGATWLQGHRAFGDRPASVVTGAGTPQRFQGCKRRVPCKIYTGSETFYLAVCPWNMDPLTPFPSHQYTVHLH